MSRLSLTCRRRLRRRQIVVAYWNQVMVTVVWFFITLCNLIVKYKSNRPHIRSISSNSDRYPILHRYAYDSDTMSLSTNVQSEEVSSARSKKRKSIVDPFIEGISNVAALLGKELREASATLSQSLNANVELQKKTSMVSSEISKIPFISQRDKFKASRKIMREPEAVLTFWNLEGEERETFVKLMLEE